MVVRSAAAIAALLLVIVPLDAVQAQATDGPALGPPASTLYAHSGGGSLWMNTVQEDEDGTDPTVNLVFFEQTSGSASFDLTPQFPQPVVLDGAADIQFNIWFGSGLLANVGTLSTELTQGETVIAEASGEVAPTVSSYSEVKFAVKPTVTDLDPAAGPLRWTISFEGGGTAYIEVSQDGNWCNLVLPIVSAGSPVDNATANLTENVTATNTTADANLTTPATNSTTNSTTLDAAQGNTTAAADAKQSPPAGLVPLLLAVAVVAALARRKSLPP